MANHNNISPDKPLTPKQKKFADLYLQSLNANQSAIKAGYSAKSAREIGSDNLTKPNIAKYIQENQLKVQEKLEITKEEWVGALGQMASAHVGQLYRFDEDGNLELRDDLTENDLKNVKKVTQTVSTDRAGVEHKTTTLEMYPRDKPMETLGKALGFIDTVKPGPQNNNAQTNNYFTQLNQYIINQKNGLHRKSLSSDNNKAKGE
jgi:phage terminase small subunit